MNPNFDPIKYRSSLPPFFHLSLFLPPSLSVILSLSLSLSPISLTHSLVKSQCHNGDLESNKGIVGRLVSLMKLNCIDKKAW